MTKLARALNSSDLSHREYLCDSDVVRAAGLTAIHRELGVLILEAKESAAGESSHAVARIRALEDVLGRYVRRWAMRWQIRLEIAPVASLMVRELILDRCQVCQGRGFIPMRYDGHRLIAVAGETDEPTKDAECATCLGSGRAKRNYHARAQAAGFPEYTQRLGEWWEAALGWCTDAELSAQRMLGKKLFGRLRNEID